MKLITTNISAALLLVTFSAFLTGCQQTGNWIAKRFESSDDKSKIVRNQPPPAATLEEITPEKQARIQLTMARAHERQGNAERAFELYEEAVKAAPNSAAAHHRLAVLLDKQGQVDQSHEHYRKALKLEPKNAEIYSDYGYSCYLQGRMDEAEKHLRHALALDPNVARAHNNLGILLARKGDVPQALSQFQFAGCTEGEARVNLAMGLLAEGNLDAANQQLALAESARGVSAETRAKMVKLQTLVARVDTREAPPLPPQTTTAKGVAPPADAEGVSRIPSVTTTTQTIDFVSPATFQEAMLRE